MTLFFSFGKHGWTPGPAVRAGAISGLMFGIWMALVNHWQSRRYQANPPDSAGEETLFEGVARHFGEPKIAGGRGGYLVLTKQRLLFRAYRPNQPGHDWSVNLLDLSRVEISKKLRVIPNGLLLTLSNGKRERFDVYAWRRWLTVLDEARTAVTQSQA